jgi:hypothetical protein
VITNARERERKEIVLLQGESAVRARPGVAYAQVA